MKNYAKKLLSVSRLLALVALFTGSPAFCADSSGNPGNDGSPITAQPALQAPEPLSYVLPAPADVRPHHAGGGDYVAFRDNVYDHPDIAAQALIRLLDRLPPDRKEIFVARHYSRIAEMVARLDAAVGSGVVLPTSYKEITSGLSRFEINTVGGRDAHAGGGSQKGMNKKNPLDGVIDVRRKINSGDRRGAQADLKALKEGYPDNPGVQSAVAQFYNDMKNYVMAASAATDAINLDPGNPDVYKTRAMARISLKDRRGAIEDIRKAMEMDPQDESAKILSALVSGAREPAGLKSLSSLEEIKRTMDNPGASGEVKPADASGADAPDAAASSGTGGQAPDYARSSAYLKTASAKNQLGDYRAAVKYADLAIEKNPAGLEAYLERANANNFLGRYDEAVKDTTRVISRDPSSVQALNMRAWALNRLGMAKDAESDADKAIGINPDFADAWFNRALAYEKQGNYKKMLEDYRQAASLNSAYGARFQDAVAQYSDRVPDFSYGPVTASGGRGSGLTRFLIMLGFTLTGGLLVAFGLMHIVTSTREKALADGKISHPVTLSPSVFYEGVVTGKYRIDRKIGEGGMGVVYEATDQSLGRKVAIKKMNDEIKVNGREKQRFLDEARTVAMLHHPNIVEIHTIFEEDDNVYLVFEHVDGVTLDRLLDKEARLPFGRVREIFDQAAKALAYAHSKSVVHRDLKLSNIMISGADEVKVMDFGLAWRVKESLARVTASHEVVGSPAYMPPEQDLGVSTKESDVYSLGVCLYEALTGNLPFKGPDFHFQKERHLYQPASIAVSGLPEAVDDLIAKALAPDPAERFKTAEEFRAALLDIPA